ncbi:sigma-54-dependent transcriptional regulator [Marinimicrobium locisalis]|uniref:sigma-54-dependent transcriptional regulator n=1 Tax=Marinimicrobium locisalis TaxID=546022 RepID=UPI00322171DF
MSHHRVLVIDDEPDIRELLSITLSRMGLEADSVENLAQAKTQLNHTDYDLCLTDMRLPDGNGLELVEHIQQHYPRLPVAVITAYGSIDLAIESMKAGAFDFVSKPVDLAALRNLVTSAIQSSQLPPSPLPEDCPILGQSKPIQNLVASIQKLARSQAPVYISGESGVGKELVARSIHKLGPRSGGQFVAVNCGAIPRELMESEFFGHKKGSFTGAHQDKAGLFQAAEGGTLFLDEVADLPLDMQVKLLRAIQEKAIRPVGGQGEVKTDVRILCATHKALDKEVQEGRFRQDLFYRLNVIQLRVPPLRERREDIPMLARHSLEKMAKEVNFPTPQLSQAAMKQLGEYPFPGNVRELENILERAFTLCESTVIDKDDLHLPEQPTALEPPEGETPPANEDHADRCADYPSLDHYLQEIEKDILCKALEQAKWNKTQAAKNLGISFRSLRYRLQKLGLDDD